MWNGYNDWGYDDSSNPLITIASVIFDGNGVSTEDVKKLINDTIEKKHHH